MRRLLIALALSASCTPTFAAEPGPAPAISINQDLLPALTARRERAEARTKAAEAYFAGRVGFAEAFPDLVDTALGDPGMLRSLQEELRLEGLERAAQRVSSAPPGAAPGDVLLWRTSTDRTCDAEDRAAALRLRLLLALERGLAVAPGLDDASVRRRLDELAAVRVPESGEPHEAVQEAVAAADESRTLHLWRRAAWDAMARHGDGGLERLVTAALVTEPARAGRMDGVQLIATRGQQDRLVRVRPLLAPEVAASATAWIEAADGLLYPPAPEPAKTTDARGELASGDEIAAELEVARGAQSEAAHRHAALAGDPASTPGLIRSAQDDLAQADERVAGLERDLATARTAEEAGLRATGARVEDADRLAEEARQRSEAEAETQRVAELRLEIVAIRSATAGLVRRASEQRRAAAEDLAGWRQRLTALHDERAAAEALSVLDPDRRRRIDAAYLGTRELCTNLQIALDDRRARAAELAALAPPPVSPVADADPSDVLAERREALDAYVAQKGMAGDGSVADQDAVVRLLVEAKRERRAARGYASAEARTVGQRAFLPELAEEAVDMPLVIGAGTREARRWASGWWSAATDLTTLVAVFRELSAAALAGCAWLVGRRLAPGLASRTVGWLTDPGSGGSRLLDRLEPGDPQRLPDLLGRALRCLVDVVFACGAVIALRGIPVASVLAWGLLAWAAWRAIPPSATLAISTTDAPHPSPWRGAAADRARLIDTAHVWVGSWFAFTVFDAVLLDILGADRVAQVSAALYRVGLFGVVVATAWAWQPTIRSAVSPTFGGGAATFARDEGARWLRVPRALVGSALIVADRTLRAAREWASSSERLGWLGTALARRDVDVGDTLSPLDDSIRRRLEPADSGPPLGIARAVAWVADLGAQRECGLAVIVGRRGDGLDDLPTRLQTLPLDVVACRPPTRLTTEAEGLAWLGAALGFPGVEERALIEHLERTPRKIIVLSDMNLALLRRVDGFEAIRIILRVAQALAEEHLVVCCIDEETWRFFEGAPGVVDPALFRLRHAVRVMTADELGRWLLDPMERQGLVPSFPGSGGDELRARRAYFRLLSDATQGRSETARRLWLTTLRQGADPEVVVHTAPPAAAEVPVGDDDLFLFTAVTMQGSLTDDELASVLNQPVSAVRSRCLRLSADGWLTHESGRGWNVPDAQVPRVILTLRRKAFLGAT